MIQSVKIKIAIAYFLCSTLLAFGQIKDSLHDTLKLPFAISKEKRLSDDDLKDKKEGVYITGIPDLNSDPQTLAT